MTILWDSDQTAGATYALSGDDPVQLVHAGASVIRALVAEPEEMLVIVGPEVAMGSACALAAQVRGDRPEVSVILLRPRLEVTVLAQALRAGFREVVASDDPTSLAAARHRSLALSQHLASAVGSGQSPDAKIITVFNTKGGCGKTTISVNLGAYMASTGARVLLVDLDLAFGDVAITLQLQPEASILDLVAAAGRVDQDALAAVVTRHGSGLDIVCAPSFPADAERVSGELVGELLRVARRCYEYVIVDTPPAFSEHVLQAFDVTDLAVLLATLDVPAVKNLRMTLDTLDLLGFPPGGRAVILNRSDAKVGLDAKDVAAVLRAPIAAMIHSSAHVPASVNRGVPIVLDEPRHPVSLALAAFADQHLLGVGVPASPDARRRLFRRKAR